MSGISRRQALAGLGSISVSALIAACSDDDDSPPDGRGDRGSLLFRRRQDPQTVYPGWYPLTTQSHFDDDSLYRRDLELTLSKERDGYLGLITLDVARA